MTSIYTLSLASRKERVKAVFLTNATHQIHTPVNAIVGMDEMILRGNQDKKLEFYVNVDKNFPRIHSDYR